MMDTLKLNVSTPSDLEILMTREFNAPRHLVFAAMTNPELLKRWFYGPDGWALEECEVSLQVGGKYRYVWRGPEGERMVSGGVCKEIAPPEKWVATEKFEDPWFPGESIVTMLWKDSNGGTSFSLNMLFETKEARDGALQSGMETGVAAGYDRLDPILDSLKTA
jgi:uncharacterized protein YndB with AHSA1/START domain